MIVKRNPAIVISPAPKLLWLQAYPNGFPSKQKTYPLVVSHLAKTKPFTIPEKWFAAAQNKANPWSCKPAKVPCGKADTAYWACTKKEASH